MTEILVDLHGLTVKLDVDSPITTYQLEEFLEDYYGIDGEIVLLYQPNPYGSRHYRCGRRPELTIGDGETSANVTINGVPKILQGVAKVQTEFEILETGESLGKRKRTLDSAMPPDAKRGRHYLSTAVERPTIIGDATGTARLSAPSASPSASSSAARQSSATAGLHPEATRGAASSARGRSVRGIHNSLSAEGDTEGAVASIEAKKGLHLTVGWTGIN